MILKVWLNIKKTMKISHMQTYFLSNIVNTANTTNQSDLIIAKSVTNVLCSQIITACLWTDVSVSQTHFTFTKECYLVLFIVFSTRSYSQFWSDIVASTFHSTLICFESISVCFSYWLLSLHAKDYGTLRMGLFQ